MHSLHLLVCPRHIPHHRGISSYPTREQGHTEFEARRGPCERVRKHVCTASLSFGVGRSRYMSPFYRRPSAETPTTDSLGYRLRTSQRELIQSYATGRHTPNLRLFPAVRRNSLCRSETCLGNQIPKKPSMVRVFVVVVAFCRELLVWALERR